MAKKNQMFVLVAVVMLFAAPAGADPDVQEGMWEITTVTKMSGTAIQMPPQKHTQCFANDDLVPRDSQAAQGCVIKEKSYEGNTLNWTMECSSNGVTTVSTGSITYDKDSFSGGMEIAIGGAEMKLVNTMSGRRLGPCK
jgi:hypothetical protein